MRSPRAGRDYPDSQAAFYSWFPDDDAILTWLAKERWRAGFACPACKGASAWAVSPGLMRCASCRRRVGVLSGTPLHRQRLRPKQLLEVAWLMTWQSGGISAKALSRSLGVKYETAWLCLHKYREVMHALAGQVELRGIVEVDETYLGGGKGMSGKHCVVVCVERKKGGKIRLSSAPTSSAKYLVPIVKAAVPDVGKATIRTDGNTAYAGLKALGYRHTSYNISQLPKPAHVYLPAIHSAAANLKSWMLGTLHRAPKQRHLDYYLAEWAYRYNLRGTKNRGTLFYRLLEATMQHGVVPQSRIVSR